MRRQLVKQCLRYLRRDRRCGLMALELRLTSRAFRCVWPQRHAVNSARRHVHSCSKCRRQLAQMESISRMWRVGPLILEEQRAAQVAIGMLLKYRTAASTDWRLVQRNCGDVAAFNSHFPTRQERFTRAIQLSSFTPALLAASSTPAAAAATPARRTHWRSSWQLTVDKRRKGA